MQEPFNNKEGNPLERNVLYLSLNRRWPMSFQGYEFRQEGIAKMLKAVFRNFDGIRIYFSKEEVELLITPTTPEQIQKYVSSAKTLLRWLLDNYSPISHTSTMTPEEIENLNAATEQNLELGIIAQKAQRQAKYTEVSKDPLENHCCPS